MDELQGMVDHVLAQLREKFADPTGQGLSPWQQIKRSVLAFVYAVRWSEPWLVATLVTLMMTLLLVLLFRRNTNVQCTIFVLLSGVVFGAERLNEFLGKHWQRFATQPYFDKHGVFISTVLTGPLLIIMMVIICNLLAESVSLMIKSKRAEFKYRARQLGKAEAAVAGESKKNQ